MKSLQKLLAKIPHFLQFSRFGRLTQDRSFRPWLRFEPLWRLSSLYKRQQKILQILHGFTTKVISERKLEYGKVAKKSKTEEKVETDENIYFKCEP